MSKKPGSRGNREIKWLHFLTVSIVIFLSSASLTQAKDFGPPGSIIPGKFIIQLEEGSSPEDLADELESKIDGFKKGHVFSSVLNGFSVEILTETKEEMEDILKDLEGDFRILSIEPDRVVGLPQPVGILGNMPGSPNFQGSAVGGVGSIAAVGQTTPNGIKRINAHLNLETGAGVKIAIIDTGIALNHPDLAANIGGNVAFLNGNGTPTLGTNAGNDDNGHGTHVAGIVAAIDNDFGVVGVAPQAELWAVKVLAADGTGPLSDVIAGVEYVAANNINVANMSLSLLDLLPAFGLPTPLCTAIKNATAAGVTIVAAAGNSGWPWPADFFSPANCPDVITVSAIVDTDGLPGGNGVSTFFGADDSFAFFSNGDLAVDIAAPGVDILSTWMTSGNIYTYTLNSGTSMAAPHVAGAAALYLEAHPLDFPADVKAGLIEAAFPQHGPEGFMGDPDHGHPPSPIPDLAYDEPLVNVMWGTPLPPTTLPTPTPTPTPGPATGSGISISISAGGVDQGQNYRIKAELMNSGASDVTVTLRCFASVSGSTETSCGFHPPVTIVAGGKFKVELNNTSTTGLPVGTYNATVRVFVDDQKVDEDSVVFKIK